MNWTTMVIEVVVLMMKMINYGVDDYDNKQ